MKRLKKMKVRNSKNKFPPNTEEFEIKEFIRYYKNFPRGRSFKIVEKNRECPDYIVKDIDDGSCFGVELTSVYIDDRSVPDRHFVGGLIHISDDSKNIERYKARLLNSIRNKIVKAQKHYLLKYPLILSVYVNEYEKIFMDEQDWLVFIAENALLFNNIFPFVEVVFWPVCGGRALSVPHMVLANNQ